MLPPHCRGKTEPQSWVPTGRWRGKDQQAFWCKPQSSLPLSPSYVGDTAHHLSPLLWRNQRWWWLPHAGWWPHATGGGGIHLPSQLSITFALWPLAYLREKLQGASRATLRSCILVPAMPTPNPDTKREGLCDSPACPVLPWITLDSWHARCILRHLIPRADDALLKIVHSFAHMSHFVHQCQWMSLWLWLI